MALRETRLAMLALLPRARRRGAIVSALSRLFKDVRAEWNDVARYSLWSKGEREGERENCNFDGPGLERIKREKCS